MKDWLTDCLILVAAISFTLNGGETVSKPLTVFKTFKLVFKGCMRFTDKNVVASCTLAVGACVTQFLPWYQFNKEMIPMCQIMINLASMSIKESNDVIDLISEAD